MPEVDELRHEVLFAPFGFGRDDRWDDAGADRRHLVALAGERLVGYASLLLEPDGSGHVRQVCVTQAMQGRGVGAVIMAEVEAEAARLGIEAVWLNARVTAERFYLRLGYATVSGEFPSGRTGLPHVRMERRSGF
jgi:hypothetical protein